MAENNKSELRNLGEKCLLTNEKQRVRSYACFDSKRNDAEFIEKMRLEGDIIIGDYEQ